MDFKPLGQDKEGEPNDEWICGPLHIEAVTFDGQDNNYGRLLKFRNTCGRWRTWGMPMELLAGLGNEVRAELLAMGVEIGPRTRSRNLLATYLQADPPQRRIRCALQVGWCGTGPGASFVLPDTVIGPDAGGVIFQSGERGHDEHTAGGTLEGWQTGVAARAIGNPLLILSLSLAFAGPLLAKCNAESGGIHAFGLTSTGKTTRGWRVASTEGGRQAGRKPSHRRTS